MRYALQNDARLSLCSTKNQQDFSEDLNSLSIEGIELIKKNLQLELKLRILMFIYSIRLCFKCLMRLELMVLYFNFNSIKYEKNKFKK